MRRALCSFCFFAAVMTGCFGRTGIDHDDLSSLGPLPGDEAGADGAGSDSVSIDDSSVASDSSIPTDDSTTPIEDSATASDSFDIFDVIPIPDGPLGDCPRCVRDNCGTQVNKCINDPKCRSGLTCAVTKCLAGGIGGGGGGGGGGLDFKCITDCFGGDFGAAGAAISAFTCVTGKCGKDCGGLLGGLGGGGFPGGGGGFPGGVPETWTAEQVMSVDPSTKISFSMEALSPWAAEIQAEAQRQAECAH